MSAASARQTTAFYKYQLFKEKERRKKDQAFISELIKDKKWLLSEVERLKSKTAINKDI